MIPGSRLIRTPEKYNIRTEARLSAYINANVTQFQAELDQGSYCRVAVARAGAVVTISAAIPASLASLLQSGTTTHQSGRL